MERRSSQPLESTVNEVISKRFEKKQSMRWTKTGAHDLLQVQVQVLDGELKRTCERWYPGKGMRAECQAVEEQRDDRIKQPTFFATPTEWRAYLSEHTGVGPGAHERRLWRLAAS